MPLLEPTAPTVSVGDVAAMSDAALGEFMQQHRGPDGNIVLPVDGWDQLSKDERARLAERLVAHERALVQSPMAHSRPLDLGQLDARLQDVSSGRDAKNSPSQARRRRLPSEDPDILIVLERIRREDETNAYNDLVKTGSRPLYPIALLDDVSRKPEEYSELLRPWLEPFGRTGRHWQKTYTDGGVGDYTGHSSEIFQKQWVRWQDFRAWQRDNRWIEDDDDGGFPAYAEQYKNWIRERWDPRAVPEVLAELEANPSQIESAWTDKIRNRRVQRRFCREQHGGVEFADYVNAVKRRLARHGFTRPFELKEDLMQQDSLTTWIEYLCFEYWWLDRYTDTIDRLKPDYDKAWQKLADTKVLRPYETQEYIATDENGRRRQTEIDQAREARKRAQENAEQIYTSTQLDPKRLSIPKAERRRRLVAATHELRTAKAWASSTLKRNDIINEFIVGTRSTRRAEEDAARHRILLPWILNQVPLIEAESSRTEAVEHRPDTTERAKKRLHSDEDDSWERDTKKRKLRCSSLRLRSDTGAAVVAKSEQIHKQSPVKDGNRSQEGSRRLQVGATSVMHSFRILSTYGMVPQGRRRSARIAARRTTTESTRPSTTGRKDTKRDSPRDASKPRGVLRRSRRRRRGHS